MNLHLRLFSLLVFICTFSKSIAETGDSSRVLRHIDTVFLDIDDFGEKSFIHTIAPKQTVYSIAKFYGLSTEQLHLYNQQSDPSLAHPGDQLTIPLPNSAIIRFKPKDFIVWKYVNIIYTVKKGDTAYKIAKTHFKMPVDSLLKRNGLTSPVLSEGQALHVGWMLTKPIDPKTRAAPANPMMRKSLGLQKDFASANGGVATKKDRGPAYWIQKKETSTDLFCLHNIAPVGTIVQVRNHMNNKTVYVKVVGKIPDGAYGNEIIIVLSTAAGQLLGARDPKFYVHTAF